MRRRKRSVRSVSRIAAKPTTTLTSGEGELHADAEGEERRARCLAAERVDEKRLLGADPAGADRDERREALGCLHEKDVAG